MRALLRIVTEDNAYNYIQNAKGSVKDTEDLLSLYRELTANRSVSSDVFSNVTIPLPRFNSDDIPF
jgi:hypothetical protein